MCRKKKKWQKTFWVKFALPWGGGGGGKKPKGMSFVFQMCDILSIYSSCFEEFQHCNEMFIKIKTGTLKAPHPNNNKQTPICQSVVVLSCWLVYFQIRNMLQNVKTETDSLTSFQELVQTESSSDEMMPPPASPSRRPTRLRTPERTSSRKAQTPERSTKAKDTSVESSDSGVESSRMPDSTATTDTELPAAAAEDDVPQSPGRRSSKRSQTPATSRQGSSAASEPDADAEAAKSPSRRSTRRATPRLDEKEAPKSPARRSTRHLGTPEVSAAAEPASPSRRLGRRSKTPERTAVSPARQKRGAEKSGVGATSVIESEGPAPPSGDGAPRKERTASADSASPGRRATRSEGNVFEELAESVPASPGRRSVHADRTLPGESVESAPASPGRRSASRDRTPSRDLVEPASAVVSPSRQSSPASRERSAPGDSAEAASVISPSQRLFRSRSRTPERSPARTSTRLRGKGSTSEDTSALGVKDIAVVTEEVRSSRKQQKEAEAPPGAGAAVSRVAEETGRFQRWVCFPTILALALSLASPCSRWVVFLSAWLAANTSFITGFVMQTLWAWSSSSFSVKRQALPCHLSVESYLPLPPLMCKKQGWW